MWCWLSVMKTLTATHTMEERGSECVYYRRKGRDRVFVYEK